MRRRRRRFIIPWGALGVIEPLLIGVAFAVLTFSDLDSTDAWVAKLCLILACVIAAVQIILLLARRKGRMLFALVFFACGTLGMVGLALTNYVNHKRDRRNVVQAVSAPTPLPTQTPSPAVAGTSTKNEGTIAPKVEPRTQSHDRNLKQPSTVNQTMTNSAGGIQAGRDVTIGQKPSPTATEKDRKP
jgi:hypothetical protein